MPLTRSAGVLVVVLSLARVAGAQSAQSSPSKPVPQSPQTAQAGPTQEAPLRIEETVEVVATKVPESPDRVPAALEVIDGKELRSRGVTDLASALSLATGVDVAPGGDGGPASAVPEFWGVREFDAFLLVVDGVPWGGAFNPSLSTLSLDDVDRIEVLRGPAPVTFGATSFAGVIHVVHRHQGSQGEGTATFGSDRSGGVTFSAPVRLGGRWASRVAVDATRRGFSDPRTSFRRGHVLWTNAHPWGSGHAWFNVDVALVDQDPASPHPRQGPTLSSLVPLDANQNPGGAFLDDHRATFWGGFERPLRKGTWSTTASFSAANQDIFRGFLTDLTDTAPNARGLRETIDLKDLYADSHVVWPIRALSVVAGGDWLHGNGDARGADFDYYAPLSGAFAASVTPPSVLDVRITDRRDFFGGYAIVDWSATARVKISGGLRLNVTAEERDQRQQDAPPDTADAGVQTHVRPSGSLGVIVTAWERRADRVRLYANYRDTFKPAAIDFGIGGDEGEGEGVLKPETSRCYEGGVKMLAWQGRAGIDASVFLMDFENLVIARTVNGLPALMNAGTERFKGFEAGGNLVLQRHVTARASYTFHDARFRDFVMEFDGVPTQLAGKQLEMSARHLASAGVVFAPPSGLLANIDLKYTGSRYLTKRNTALAGGFVTLGAGVGYRRGRWEVRADGRNLTDERPPVAESELGDGQYYRLAARRVDVTLGVRF